jgi:large subunit ribosomal protein L40
MATKLGLRGLASSLYLRSAQPTRALSSICQRIQPSIPRVQTAFFSTTPSQPAKAGKSNKGGGKPAGKPGSTPRRNKQAPQRDPKIVNLLRSLALLSGFRLPPPLRMARNRHLRHWTIHRAWNLFTWNQRRRRETVLMQQHNSMSKACEALRLTAGPDTRPEGYLYRVAMEKKGIYGLGGVPIEYARAQTETPARVPWNHDWKR